MAERILAQGWYKAGDVTYDTRPAMVRRLGDVLQMLQVPQIERQFEPEAIDCSQVMRPDGGGIFRPTPQSEILVIGDSFLRIFEQDEPLAAGLIAHLSRALRRPVAALVSDGGASTLVRQELYRRPALLAGKKVVVWEFVERDIRLGAEGWQLVPLPHESAGFPPM